MDDQARAPRRKLGLLSVAIPLLPNRVKEQRLPSPPSIARRVARAADRPGVHR